MLRSDERERLSMGLIAARGSAHGAQRNPDRQRKLNPIRRCDDPDGNNLNRVAAPSFAARADASRDTAR
jgi:hypothetical protein